MLGTAEERKAALDALIAKGDPIKIASFIVDNARSSFDMKCMIVDALNGIKDRK